MQCKRKSSITIFQIFFPSKLRISTYFIVLLLAVVKQVKIMKKELSDSIGCNVATSIVTNKFLALINQSRKF